jgi:O-antigen/teichoic acid export membrane protein
MAASLVAALLVNCGLGLSSVYFLGKKVFPPGDIASASLVFAVTIGSIGSVVASLAVGLFGVPGLTHVPAAVLILAFASIPFYNLSDYYFYFLIGSDRIKHFNILSAARNALQLLLAVLLIVVAGLRVSGAILSWVGSFAGIALISYVLVNRLAPVRFALKAGVLGASVSFGVKGYLSRIASFLYYRIDMFILSYFMGAKAVGQYAIAVLIAELLWNIPSSLAPAVMFKSASEDSQARDLLTASACRHTLLICVSAAGCIALLGRPVVELAFGSEYLPSVTPLLVLLPGTAFLSLGGVLANDFVGRGKQLMNSFAAIVTLLINVPLNFLLIPVWGISGASAASTFSYCVGTAVMLVEFLRITGMKPAEVLVPRATDLDAYLKLAKGYFKGPVG